MSWLAFLLSTCGFLVCFLAAGNLIVGLVLVYGFVRGIRCTEHEDFLGALAMIFFGAPLFSALGMLLWWASGQIAG